MMKKINLELSSQKPEEVILSICLIILLIYEVGYLLGKAFYYFTH